jgi:hypothetical protein
MAWYSVAVQRAVFVGDTGIQSLWDSVFLVRAPDRTSAHERALTLGKSKEEEYVNANGESIRLALVGVTSIDLIGDEIVDGTEVYFIPNELDLPIPIDLDTDLHSGRWAPKSSGIGIERP